MVLGDNVVAETAAVIVSDADGRFVRATVTLPGAEEARHRVDARREALRAACASPAVADERDGEAERALERARAQPPVDLLGGSVRLRCRPAQGAAVDALALIARDSAADVFGGVFEGAACPWGYTEYTTSPETTVAPAEDTVYAVTGQAVLQFDLAERLVLAADVGGGLTVRREIGMPRATPAQVRAAGWTPREGEETNTTLDLDGSGATADVETVLEATSVGQGSGGFSRPAMLRGRIAVPLGTPDGRVSSVSFRGAGGARERAAGPGARVLSGNVGEVCLHVPRAAASGWLRLAVRFAPDQVDACVVERTEDALVLELRTPERAVSADTPLALAQTWHLVAEENEDASG